ncbi:MAG: hypothetical protein ACRDXX_09380 [Stackebrandtia sp.]
MKIKATAVSMLAVAVLTGCWAEEDPVTSDDDAKAGGTTAGRDDAEDSSTSAGTAEDPYPVGTTVVIGDWDVVFDETVLDATDAVMSENEFNPEPQAGRQFVMVGVTATNIGDANAAMWADLQFGFQGSDGTLHSEIADDSTCGVIPDPISDDFDVAPDHEAIGNVCVSVPAEYIDGGAWHVTDILETQEAYFAHS